MNQNDNQITPAPTGPLAGVKVLDLSRVLAGPWATQILGDLGATIYKIEQPGQGDDTRRWGPPFLQDGSRDSAYYLCANRNKYSIAIDLASSEGADLIRKLAKAQDSRGWLAELFRNDELDGEFIPTMAYISSTKPGRVIRNRRSLNPSDRRNVV